MKGLIAAGGRATRLRPITHAINKHLLPLAGKPLIEYAIEKMAAAGITEIAININPGETEIPQALGDGSRFGVTLTYLEQAGGPQGVGHIVHNAERWIGDEPFVFYLGDNVTLGPINHLVERFQREQLDCLLALAQVENPNRFGVPEFADGKIVRVLEKPSQPPSPYAVTGIYVYGPAVFDAARRITPSPRGEFEISDIHSLLITEGRKVGHEEVTGWWMDTGLPQDLLTCNGLLLDRMTDVGIFPDATVDAGARIEGSVRIGHGCRIAGDVAIQGPVWIGDGTQISGSAIGPHVSIGARCTLSGVTMSETLVMDDATLTLRPDRPVAKSMIGRHSRVSMVQRNQDAYLLLGDHGVVEL